ncbi:MAG TPA: HEAT repeat domain-containing protein [Actinomycetota bacterium]|nr:HEAT repeat domain-containing protein [Actinomycetota bacterium]
MHEPGSTSAGPARGTPEREVRERSVVSLLRQLWLGLSTYRLYPENPARPSFASAVERVEAAVREALAVGPVDVEIRADRFVMEGGLLARNESLDRLARACLERRVERLTVVTVPDAADLERLYETLSRSPADLEDAGGAEEVLRNAGVASVSLSPIGPGEVEEADHVPEELAASPGQRRLDSDVLASELMVEDLGGSAQDQAETLLGRLRRVIGSAAAGERSPIDLHSAVHDVLTDLPDDVRRSFVEILVDRVPADPVAERLIGTMSNAGLTRALVDIGRSGRRDPVELARQLAVAGVRQLDIVDLTKALEAGEEDAGTIIAGLEQLGVDVARPEETPAGGTVMEVLARYLSDTESEDVRSVQDAIAATGQETRAVQVMAIADYLALETDVERTGEALGIWADELRRALRERDEREVASLLKPVRDALLGGGEDRPALFRAYVHRVLEEEVVVDAVIAEAMDEQPRAATLLMPFGADGVEVLLDLLSAEEDRSRRALLLGALRQVVPAHAALVGTRLDDPRWYVVRNAVSLLGAAGDPTALRKIAGAARHAAAEVRQEVPGALVAAGGVAAVPYLLDLALGPDEDLRSPSVIALGSLVGQEPAGALADVVRRAKDRGIRIQGLDQLGRRPEGPSLLQDLRAGVGGPRLPWRLRRYARRLLSGRAPR